MTDDALPTEIELLTEMVRDASLAPNARLRALENLRALRPPERETEPVDPEAAMAAVVDQLCPQPVELKDAPPDPMRDLDAATAPARRGQFGGQGHDVDRVVWTWLPYCPPRVAQAEKEVLRAMRRLGLGPGPLPPPSVPEDEARPKATRQVEHRARGGRLQPSLKLSFPPAILRCCVGSIDQTGAIPASGSPDAEIVRNTLQSSWGNSESDSRSLRPPPRHAGSMPDLEGGQWIDSTPPSYRT